MATKRMMTSILFRQLFDRNTCTFTYLLGCQTTRSAILIDPVKEHVERDLSLIKEMDLYLRYVANTHVHADHITGSGELKKQAPKIQNIPSINVDYKEPIKVESIIGEKSGAEADIHVKEGDIIECGTSIVLRVLETPGHTNSCLSYYCPAGPYVFTGDALFIRACGRTDFQQGNAGLLYDSVHQKLFKLPDETLVYPAHDYNGRSVSTIGEEKRHNPRLTKSREEFVQFMTDLKLNMPKMIDEAVSKNLGDGN